jgi:hypothetical protein
MAALGLAVPAMSLERTYFFGPWAPEQPPKLWGDAIHDDAVALRWYLDHGKQVPRGFYLSSDFLRLRGDHPLFGSYVFPDGMQSYRFLGGVSSGVLVKHLYPDRHPQQWEEWEARVRIRNRAWRRVMDSPERTVFEARRHGGLSEEQIAAAVERGQRALEYDKLCEQLVDCAERRGSLDAEVELAVVQEKRIQAQLDELSERFLAGRALAGNASTTA